MVKTAVILAAGRGTRLKELGKEIPKGFLQLGEKPIIQESIEKLVRAGIERVIIVTGHCAEKYEELARNWNAELDRGMGSGKLESREAGIGTTARSATANSSAGGAQAGKLDDREGRSPKMNATTSPQSHPKAPHVRIFTVHNDRYADSGSLYSLYLAGKALGIGSEQGKGTGAAVTGAVVGDKAVVHDDARRRDTGSAGSTTSPARGEGFLLLESDLVYEYRALEALQEDPRPDLILVSGRTNSGDEVWVATEEGNLRALSKDRSRLEALLPRGVTPDSEEGEGSPGKAGSYDGAPRPHTGILGELVGISKISLNLFSRLSTVAERLFQKTLHVEYEAGLTETSKEYPIPCLLIPDLIWAEIDDANHLERAKGLYPRLE